MVVTTIVKVTVLPDASAKTTMQLPAFADVTPIELGLAYGPPESVAIAVLPEPQVVLFTENVPLYPPLSEIVVLIVAPADVNASDAGFSEICPAVGVAVGVGVAVADAVLVGVAVGVAVDPVVGVGDGVGVEGVGVNGVGVDGVCTAPDGPLLPCPLNAAMIPTPARPATTSAVPPPPPRATAGNTVPSTSSSRAIAQVNVSVPRGSAVFLYGGLNETAPSDPFVLSKNENVTAEDFSDAAGSKAIRGTNDVPFVSAAQLTIFAGAFGCDATTPSIVVDACASAAGTVCVATPATMTPAQKTWRAFTKPLENIEKPRYVRRVNARQVGPCLLVRAVTLRLRVPSLSPSRFPSHHRIRGPRHRYNSRSSRCR